MKNVLILMLGLTLLSCKKKNEAPAEEPAYVCSTKTKYLEGTYSMIGGSGDTITIVYDHNMCPTENQNVYVANNIDHAFNSVYPQYSITPNYVKSVNFNEVNKNGNSLDGKFYYGIAQDGKLIVKYSLNYINFKRIN
jgi:hypothetical protein